MFFASCSFRVGTSYLIEIFYFLKIVCKKMFFAKYLASTRSEFFIF